MLASSPLVLQEPSTSSSASTSSNTAATPVVGAASERQIKRLDVLLKCAEIYLQVSQLLEVASIMQVSSSSPLINVCLITLLLT